MNKVYKNLKLLLLIIATQTSVLMSQECDICEFTIDELFFNESLVGYYLGGFDLATGESDVLLFEYLINGPQSCYNQADGKRLKVTFDVRVYSPSLGLSEVTDFLTADMFLSDFTGPITFKNTDITFSGAAIDGATLEFGLNSEILVSGQQLEDMKSYVLSSGKIPNGSYIFTFSLGEEFENDSPDGNCHGVFETYSREVEIYEPTYLEIVAPGFKSISEANNNPVFTNYPVFTWSADMCSACNYGIRVSEYVSGTHSSLSEALNDFSSLPLDQALSFHPIESDGTVFQYPSSGAMELISGNYYVWQIKRDYGTTIGLQEDYSDIYIFKISSFLDESSSNLEMIKDLLGEDVYQSLFGPGGDFEGFFIKDYLLNGTTSSEQEIQVIINGVNQGNAEVIEVIIE